MIKIKKLSILIVIASLFLIPYTSAHAQRMRLKIATLAPKNLGWAILWEQHLSPWIAEATDNKLVLKIYWGGIMGNDDDYLAKMRIGQLQGAGVTGWGANLACPEFSVVGLPFLFNNYDEVDYIREVMFPTFDYYFEQNGYKLMQWIDQDFDQFYSTKYKFDTLEDFKNTKILTWYGPQEEAMLKALGASPIPMDVTDVPTAKRMGILDTNIAPSIWQVGAQLYTIDKYVNTMKIRYSPAVVIITKESWEEIPQDYRERLWIDQARVQTKFCEGVRTDNRKCLEGMISYGVEPVHPDAENMAAIQKRAMTVYEDMSGELYPPDLLMEVSKHLAVFRQGKGSTDRVVAVSEIEAMVKSAKKKASMKPKLARAEPAPAPETVPEPAPKAVPAPEKAVEAVEVAEVVVVETPKPAPAPLPTPVEAKKVEQEAEKVAAADQEYESKVKAESKDLFAEISEAYKKTEEAKKKGAVPEKEKPKVVTAPSDERQKAWALRKQRLTEIQKVLKPMNLYPYRIDGIYGPITRKGIMEYQRMNGLKVTGGITREMLDHMGIE